MPPAVQTPFLGKVHASHLKRRGTWAGEFKAPVLGTPIPGWLKENLRCVPGATQYLPSSSSAIKNVPAVGE